MLPGDAPYIHPHTGSRPDFNPRAYSQAAYAASLQSQSPRSKHQEPLVDFDRNKDPWLVTSATQPDAVALPDTTRRKIEICRGIQLGLRVVELLGAGGLLFCMVVMKGMPSTAGWIMRIYPGCDALLNSYAIYHLARAVSRRAAASSASYHSFSLSMDIGLISFYAYTCYEVFLNHKESTGTDGRWTTMFDDEKTDIILDAAWLGAAVVGGFHLFSAVLDMLLLVWFRKVARLPPNMNPLSDGMSQVSENDGSRKDSVISYSEKHSSHASTGSAATVPPGYNIPDINDRQLPFLSSRVNGDNSYSAHSRETARMARSGQGRISPHIQVDPPLNLPKTRPNSRPTSFVSERLEVRSPLLPPVPGQLRSNPPSPPVAQPIRDVQQNQSLLKVERQNWFVYDDSTVGRPLPSPVLPELSELPAVVPLEYHNRNGATTLERHSTVHIQRHPTVSSSVYSTDSISLHGGDTPRTRYYGELGSPRRDMTYDTEYHATAPLGNSTGNRNVSTSIEPLYNDGGRYRYVSGKAAEEGRGKMAQSGYRRMG